MRIECLTDFLIDENGIIGSVYIQISGAKLFNHHPCSDCAEPTLVN